MSDTGKITIGRRRAIIRVASAAAAVLCLPFGGLRAAATKSKTAKQGLDENGCHVGPLSARQKDLMDLALPAQRTVYDIDPSSGRFVPVQVTWKGYNRPTCYLVWQF